MMAEYFECLECQSVTVFMFTHPKCAKCGCGWGLVRSNIREARETLTGDRRARSRQQERRRNAMGNTTARSRPPAKVPNQRSGKTPGGR
jgi:hypothetical protein